MDFAVATTGGPPPHTPVVYIVDDDILVRQWLELLICDAGWQPKIFGSAEEFLSYPKAAAPSCLVLDVMLPGLTGLDLQKRLASDQAAVPIIFITGRGDIPTTVQAMKAGAFEFLTKPFGEQALLSAIEVALGRSWNVLHQEAELREIRDRYASLSRRQQQVMTLVVRGLLNKQVGFELGINVITVKSHRGRVMRMMKAGSLAELVRIAAKLGIAGGRNT